MAYEKQNWENFPSTETPITAERLNHMEDGIEEAWNHGGGGGAGETLPIGSEIDFDGLVSDIPDGWEQINNNPQLLWTNPNPGNAISSDTTITLSSDDYDYILWVMRVSTTNNLSCSNTSFKGYGLRTYIGGNYRNITRNNDTSYTINPANSTDFNNALIPIYAIGYKTGLFN